MPNIIPIRDMRDTSIGFLKCVTLSMSLIFVTKNGYGDMVIMGCDQERIITINKLSAGRVKGIRS